jgi:peptide-methionine (S)-S-oxide reductase
MAERELATLGGGCFWCTEAVFQRLAGVEAILSGYAGGDLDDPSYEDICSGDTGHAEVIQITFDPDVISYSQILDVFWLAHDPTTINRQGNDVGTQYRSVIFYHDDEQREEAENSMMRNQKNFASRIQTEISPLPTFWPAENYHQEYYNDNKYQPYCQFVITPKIEKLYRAGIIKDA